jgi:hypothetical protein
MTVVGEVDQLIELYLLALDEYMKGNPKPVQDLFSHREDASLANPYSPPVRGWDEVARTPRSMPHRYAETAGPEALRS